MKKILIGLLLITLGTYGQTRYELPDKSKLKWRGENILHSGHEGTLDFQSGYILVQGKVVERGEFNINMNSMFSLDEQTGTDIESLSDHLKSEDFFSVEKFPNAYFSITSVLPTKSPGHYEVKGLLTIKGIIHPITFDANMVIADALVALKAEFTIDRLLWNITYQSKNFLNDLKDTAIADDIQIKLDLVLDRK
jgi:polyisoprenoid-binding protein YceI